MRPFLRAFRVSGRIAVGFFVGTVALRATGSAWVEPVRLEPSPAAVVAAPTAGDSVELRGVLSIGGGWRFRICEPAANVAAWVGIGERCGDLIVTAYDAAAETVVVECRGITLMLAMRKTGVTMAPSADRIGARGPVPAADIAEESRRHGIERPRFGPR